MTMRIAARYVSRRLSSSGKILSEEEKAAENVYIKKTERERLEKLAKKNVTPEAASSGGSGSASDAKFTSQSTTSGVSSDKSRNYGVIAGVVVAFGALGWYLKSKKSEEVQK